MFGKFGENLKVFPKKVFLNVEKSLGENIRVKHNVNT